MQKETVSIILPTYNERGNIIPLLQSLVTVMKKTLFSFELILVDDNSNDGSIRIFNKIKLLFPVKVYIRKSKPNLALSIKKGLEESKGKYIIIMDTDFNHQPEDVPQLLHTLIGKKADMVIGSRYVAGGGMSFGKIPFLKYNSSKLFNSLIKLVLQSPVEENLSGFLAIRRSVLQTFPYDPIFRGYGDYCIRLIYYAKKKGCKILEIPVRYGNRVWGDSKTKLIQHSLQYLGTIVDLKIRGIK